ncbi:GmrSD restriction endonuclease domain-containing protein [Streptomyces europaeiscabiei]|uniref:GmrSD restriction endonuclease domain-containing protein n=1 Tax=Streptomyces europaeiscabiei TaxID=146819 RepID=UPI0038F62E40
MTVHISQVLDKVDAGDIALPEFQRGYVWTRDQVRGFFQSLYRGYPIGGFLTWSTKAEGVQTRGGDSGRDGTIHLLLDGQQRVTTLYGVTRGRAPSFFEGNASALTGLHFNLQTEAFEFYAPAKMKDNPVWVDVTALFQSGLASQLLAVTQLANGDADLQVAYIERLNRITQIKDRSVHIDEVTGEDKTIDVVVEIFNRVNSGGTKLSKGDLALAAICAAWPAARPTMNQALQDWSTAGFSFKLDWLLRNVNAVITGEAQFSKLADVDVPAFRSGLAETIDSVSYLLNALGGRLGLDHGAVLSGRGALPVMSRLLHHHGGSFPDAMTRDRLFYWYVHSFLWGRHTGATETVLNQDLQALDDGGVDQLISVLRRSRGGHLAVGSDDFVGSSMGSRFYPLLYMLTRVYGAQDFVSGVPLRDGMLGRLSSLQVHHIFPKALLYKHDYSRAEVNAVANFCFLTQDTNLKIGAKEPAEYLEEIESRMPGALATQWIPMDRDLWKVSNYPDFLAARRALLARAANEFLQGLHDGPSPVALADSRASLTTASSAAPPDTAETDAADEVPGLRALLSELREADLAAPELDSEVSDPHSGAAITVAAAFWPQGLWAEGGVPVVLAPDTTEEEQAALEAGDYRIFHSTDALRGYIRNLRAER